MCGLVDNCGLCVVLHSDVKFEDLSGIYIYYYIHCRCEQKCG